MDAIWKTALQVAGLGAVGCLILWLLYRKWLDLPIFQPLTKKQLFALLLVFLVLTAACAIIAIITYGYISIGQSKQLAIPPKKSDVAISSVRFSLQDPDHLDILLRNIGDTAAILDKAIFTVHAIHSLFPNEKRAKELLTSAIYTVELHHERVPYTIEIPIQQAIEADSADRFQFALIDKEEPPPEFAYEFSFALHADGQIIQSDRILFLPMRGTSYLPPPETESSTLRLFRKWSRNDCLKSERLQRLIDRFASAM